MIILNNKSDCCGCTACVQRCPKQCITMVEDEEGFLNPQINISLCVNCGLCEKVCPVINQNESSSPLAVYAAKNPKEEIRIQSSSGGIFTMIAEQIIAEGGVVFGVGFNNHWEAAHRYTETKEGLAAFRMSKYVQSIVGDTFKEAETFLKQGRKVLYSGTPCQIAGLNRFLGKRYDSLFTVDFICHGTPSPGVFRWYLSEELARIACKKNKKKYLSFQSIPKVDVLAKEYGYEINDIRFRDKREGWKKFSFSFDISKMITDGMPKKYLISDTLDKNVFLRGFLKDLYLRPSCYTCPTKELKSGSDITIGDYWGIEKLKPEIDDDKGISVVIVNTNKGQTVLKNSKLEGLPMDYNELCKYNPAILYSACRSIERDIFYKNLQLSFYQRIDKLCRISFKSRVKKKVVNLLKGYLDEKQIQIVKRIINCSKSKLKSFI